MPKKGSSKLVTVTCSNHYQRLMDGLWNFLQSQHLTDLDCPGENRAHRLIVEIFMSADKLCQADTDESSTQIGHLIEFLYRGEVTIPEEDLKNFVETTQQMDLKMVSEDEPLPTGSKKQTVGKQPPVAKKRARTRSSSESVAALKQAMSTSNGLDEVIGNNDGDDNPPDDGAATEEAEEQPPFQCSQCPKTFENRYERTAHQYTHERPVFKCDACSRSFPSRMLLNMHKRQVHQGLRPFKCPVAECGARFPTHKILRSHALSHAGFNRFMCDICGGHYKSEFGLQVHIGLQHVSPHRDTQKDLTCTICDKTLTSPSTLAAHMTVHTRETPFPCTLCPKKFSRQQDLKLHLGVHMGVRPHHCSVCGKGFQRLSRLKDHEVKFHDMTY